MQIAGSKGAQRGGAMVEAPISALTIRHLAECSSAPDDCQGVYRTAYGDAAAKKLPWRGE
jgi:hypothetical protein